MARTNAVVSFKLNVTTEEREGYFAATTDPFAITLYGKTEAEAEAKAEPVVRAMLAKYSKQPGGVSAYLNRLGVKHSVRLETVPEPTVRRPVRQCSKDVNLKVAAGAGV